MDPTPPAFTRVELSASLLELLLRERAHGLGLLEADEVVGACRLYDGDTVMACSAARRTALHACSIQRAIFFSYHDSDFGKVAKNINRRLTLP